MCQARQLRKLLRYFNVPSGASYAEVRQAYLQRVKQVHPDRSSAPNSEEFRELHQNFEKAAELIRVQATSHGVVRKVEPHYYDPVFCQHNQKPPAPTGVKAEGLPAQTVYSCAVGSALAIAAASFWLSQRRQSSSTITESSRPVKTIKEIPALPSAEASIEQQLPSLQSGPWNVSVAKEVAHNLKAVWAPSKAWEFQNGDSFYGNRMKGGHMCANSGQRRGDRGETHKDANELSYGAPHQLQKRDGVEIFPVHVAAEEGNVWWLELCGATAQCRSMLVLGDSIGNTPLHHSAESGQKLACEALLRLGADPCSENAQKKMPEDLAETAGHANIKELLCEARRAARCTDQNSVDAVIDHRHPDGLGIHAEPPPGVIFTGLQGSGGFRRAVDMGAGFLVTPPLPVSRTVAESKDAADRIVNIARGSLSSTAFEIEDLPPTGSTLTSSPPSGAEIWQRFQRDGCTLCGLLIYESPGIVTPDAPGHWVAVRPVPEAKTNTFFRLDPVRGPFRISDQELALLLQRYRAWRVIQTSRS